MATDATGTPTSLGIPTYNVNVDAPSGNGNTAQMQAIDALLVARATIASPAFTGTPTAPTPATGDNSTKIATTAFVAALAALTRQIFTSGTGTYTTPAGVKAILVELLGGGGTGGQAQTSSNAAYAAGSGGNGGTYASKLIINPVATYAYAVGAGGAALAGGGTLTSNNGGDTTFGSTIVVAKGGTGGTVDGSAGHTGSWAVNPPAPQAGSVGDIVIPGARGGLGKGYPGGTIAEGGEGGHGAGPYGGAGAITVVAVGNASVAGSSVDTNAFGAGSSGSIAGQFSGGAIAVAAGGSGLIVVTELY